MTLSALFLVVNILVAEMYQILLFLLPAIALAVYQFDNALTGTLKLSREQNDSPDTPKIECGHDHVALSVTTTKDLPAHIFAKGHFKKVSFLVCKIGRIIWFTRQTF